MILMHPRQVGSVRQVTEERVDVALNRSTLQEGYSVGGFEGIECECCGDGLLECVQGPAVGGVEDSPGFDVGDGALFRPGGSC